MLPFVHTRACPTCGQTDVTDTVRAQNPAEEDVPLQRIRDNWNGFFKENIFFTYRRCHGCGLLYAPRHLTSAAMADLYSNMPDNTAGLPRPIMELTQRGYFEAFARHSPLVGVYGEVGPDIGLFTQNCVRDGSFSAYHLWEPNRGVHGSLETLLAGRPHTITGELFNLDSVPDGTLSALVIIHVLDHLLDPRPLMEEAFAKLAAGGIVLVVTHDERSLLARAIGRRWPAYGLQHPQLYSPASMREFLTGCGFTVREIQKSRNYFPADYLARHALWAAGIHHPTIPTLNRPVLGIPLGNILTIAARR
jgi:hypothetical protein